MVFAVFFLSMSAACAWLAVSEGGVAWLFAWPSVTFAILALAYLGVGPRVFGKRADGTSNIAATLVMLPYLAPLRSLWWLLRARNDKQPHVKLVEAQGSRAAVVIGRRLRAGEFPDGLACVVDLTCEFESESRRTAIPQYISLPILDAYVPSADALIDLIRRINDVDGSQGAVYVHCAEGRGRTALVACALLLARGHARDVDEAVAFVREKRLVMLSGAQRSLLLRMQNDIARLASASA